MRKTKKEATSPWLCSEVEKVLKEEKNKKANLYFAFSFKTLSPFPPDLFPLSSLFFTEHLFFLHFFCFLFPYLCILCFLLLSLSLDDVYNLMKQIWQYLLICFMQHDDIFCSDTWGEMIFTNFPGHFVKYYFQFCTTP